MPEWFEAGGASGAVAVYQPIGAASLAASYTDLSGTGNDAAPGVAPTWDARHGWTFNGSTQYLLTGVLPDDGYSLVVRFSDHGDSNGAVVGSFNGNRFGITPNSGSAVRPEYGNTNTPTDSPQATSGVLALTPTGLYREGVKVQTITGTFSSAGGDVAIGARNRVDLGTRDLFFSGRVQAIAIYDNDIADDVAAITAAAKALGEASPGTDDLVSWWSLDEESGTRADSHGSNTLADNNTVGYASGKLGYAADFEKDNQESLSIADGSQTGLSGDNVRMLCGWVQFESITGAQLSIATKYTGGGGNQEYILRLNTSGNMEIIWYSTGGSDRTSVAGPFSTGQWYFVAAWYDDALGTLGVRVDDGLPAIVGTGTLGGGDGAADFVLGGRDGSAVELDGLLDEWSAWSRHLSVGELDWLRNSGAGRTYADLAPPSGSPLPAILTALAAAGRA